MGGGGEGIRGINGDEKKKKKRNRTDNIAVSQMEATVG